MEVEGVDPDKEHPVQASEQLQESLKARRELVADLRLTNSNEPPGPDEFELGASSEPKD